MNYNNIKFSIVENGFNIMVYDRVTGDWVENAGFENAGGKIQYKKIFTKLLYRKWNIVVGELLQDR